jgi:hypothetical protein
MKKHMQWLALLGIMLSACGSQPPEATNQPSIATESIPSVVSTVSTGSHAADVAVASKMAGILSSLETVQQQLDDDTTAMAMTTIDASTIFSLREWHFGKMAMPPALPLAQIENVPQGFLDPLPENGAIPGEAGSCGAAAAKPEVTFFTVGGQAVTPQLLANLNLQTIPTELVTMPQDDPQSLFALITSLVKMGDPRMGTAQGWNDLLWNQLKARQKPAQSLMDYQLWNASPEIEAQVADLYKAQLKKLGVPQIVLDAYEASNRSGWYANTPPTPESALAKMDIQAVMSGSIEGTVHEQREFRIPGAGQTPEFGPQTGEGTVTWDAPGLGTLTFEVDILLDQFDERGHAVGGQVVGIDAEKGYTVQINFQPDGTRAGEILRNGELVGRISMTVDETQFKNYLDLETNQTEPLPLP